MQDNGSETTDTEQWLSFKEMCTKFEVTPRTLRYYEAIELLFPERDGSARYYTPRDVARMTLILRGRRFGFALEEIRQWLLIYDEKGNRAQMEAWVDLATRQLQTLVDQQEQLEETIDVLRTLRDQTVEQLSAD